MGKAFEHCDVWIKEVLGFDAKTGNYSDDLPDGGIFEFYECSPENAMVVNGIDGIIYCCENWNSEIGLVFDNCATEAVATAELGAIACAGSLVTITAFTGKKLIAAGSAVGGPIGAAIGGGITIIGGGVALYQCLSAVRDLFNSQCGTCLFEASEACNYTPCG